MNRLMRHVMIVAVILTAATFPVRAQWVVYDPANWAEAVLQYEQLLQQYQLLLKQAARLPLELASRYHGHSVDWTDHPLDAGLLYALKALEALNDGDETGTAYQSVVDPLTVPTDVMPQIPDDLRRRLETAYATIELADSVNRVAINQVGASRVEGPPTQQALKNVERDNANPDEDFHTQIALLQKITAAEAIGLRLEDRANQLQLNTLELLMVENKRKRDAEAKLMNAVIHQWRYGTSYGGDLFQHTAHRLDTWRQD